MDDSKRRKRASPPAPHRSLTPVPSIDSDDAGGDGMDDEEGVSLEELSQSYQRALGDGDREKRVPLQPTGQVATQLEGSDPNVQTVSNSPDWQDIDPFDLDDARSADNLEEDCGDCPLTPQSILEAVFFVGRHDNSPISAAEIASLMRGVTESEVIEAITKLNETYAKTNRATRIAPSGVGYRLQLADDLSSIRDRFYGSIRKVKLNQAAVDCLALISYQPGIAREKLEEQRGQSSGSLLTQLIRRQLIEVRRETEGKKQVQRYYPTDRLLDLAGIESLDDLPQTEDFD